MFNLSIFLEGMLAAMVMGLVAVVLQIIKVSRFNFMLAIGRFFIKKSQQQALATSLGWIIHLLMGGLMAEVYFWLVTKEIILLQFNLITTVIWAAFLWLITMFAVMPLLEGGIFGVKFGKFKWLEMLVLFLVYGYTLNYLILTLIISLLE